MLPLPLLISSFSLFFGHSPHCFSDAPHNIYHEENPMLCLPTKEEDEGASPPTVVPTVSDPAFQEPIVETDIEVREATDISADSEPLVEGKTDEKVKDKEEKVKDSDKEKHKEKENERKGEFEKDKLKGTEGTSLDGLL